MIRKKWLVTITGIIMLAAGLYLFTENATPLMKGYTKKPTENLAEASTVNKPIEKHVKKVEALYPVHPKKGEEIGTLVIPKLDAILPIFHGTDEDELEKGVGHFAGSVLPGEKDNSVLSGHRDTVFRKLGDVGEGDLLVVSTSVGEFTYKVRKVRIVDADDRTVIVPKPRATLTVTTCYPFYYIGDAPQRYILVADLIEKKIL